MPGNNTSPSSLDAWQLVKFNKQSLLDYKYHALPGLAYCARPREVFVNWA